MFYFQKAFQESKKSIIEFEGITYHRYFSVKIETNSKLFFEFMKSNTLRSQAIVIIFPKNFNGRVFCGDKELPIKKSSFPKLIFWEDSAPKSFEIQIIDYEGTVEIANGADPIGDKQICQYLALGCAMIVDEIGKNKYRFSCNDYENNVDCDDLIFELTVTH